LAPQSGRVQKNDNFQMLLNYCNSLFNFEFGSFTFYMKCQNEKKKHDKSKGIIFSALKIQGEILSENGGQCAN